MKAKPTLNITVNKIAGFNWLKGLLVKLISMKMVVPISFITSSSLWFMAIVTIKKMEKQIASTIDKDCCYPCPIISNQDSLSSYYCWIKAHSLE